MGHVSPMLTVPQTWYPILTGGSLSQDWELMLVCRPTHSNSRRWSDGLQLKLTESDVGVWIGEIGRCMLCVAASLMILLRRKQHVIDDLQVVDWMLLGTAAPPTAASRRRTAGRVVLLAFQLRVLTASLTRLKQALPATRHPV